LPGFRPTATDTEHRRRGASFYMRVATDRIRRYRITQWQTDLCIATIKLIHVELERTATKVALVALQADTSARLQAEHPGRLDTKAQHHAVWLDDLVIDAVVGELESRIVTA